MFAQIIEIDSTNIDARFGRILSLIYLSKLRRSRFPDAILMIKEESQIIFHKVDYFEKYAKFLIDVNHAVDDYHSNLKKKLTFRNYFYDDECIKLFFKKDNEICDIKKFILDEVTWLNTKHETDELTMFSSELEKSIREYEKEIGGKLLATDGMLVKRPLVITDKTVLTGFKENEWKETLL